jgi:hypothetical protein
MSKSYLNLIEDEVEPLDKVIDASLKFDELRRIVWDKL